MQKSSVSPILKNNGFKKIMKDKNKIVKMQAQYAQIKQEEYFGFMNATIDM